MIELRVENDAAAIAKRARTEREPSLVFPLETCVVEIDKKRIDRASFMLVPARTTHRIGVNGSTAKLATLVIGPEARRAVLREYAPHADPDTFQTIVSESRVFPRTRWVDELVHRYVFERDVCEKHESLAARFLETELTKELYFLGAEQLVRETRASVVEEDDDLVVRARAWLDEHLFEPVRTSQLARHCKTSESTLLRAFRRALGVPPTVYLRNRRLEEALLLLESHRYTVSEVAVRVGYGNLSAFTTAFRRRFGVAPSATRAAKDTTAKRLPPQGRRPHQTR
jgi:AraC-like DNA-binding protein